MNSSLEGPYLVCTGCTMRTKFHTSADMHCNVATEKFLYSMCLLHLHHSQVWSHIWTNIKMSETFNAQAGVQEFHCCRLIEGCYFYKMQTLKPPSASHSLDKVWCPSCNLKSFHPLKVVVGAIFKTRGLCLNTHNFVTISHTNLIVSRYIDLPFPCILVWFTN